jgi:hypothetical protein
MEQQLAKERQEIRAEEERKEKRIQREFETMLQMKDAQMQVRTSCLRVRKFEYLAHQMKYNISCGEHLTPAESCQKWTSSTICSTFWLSTYILDSDNKIEHDFSFIS